MTTALAFLGVVVLHATWLGLAITAAVALAYRRLGPSHAWWRHTIALAGLLLVTPVALAITTIPHLDSTPSTITSVGSPTVLPTFSLAPATPWIGLLWLLGVAWGLLGLTVASAGVARIRRSARLLPVADAERLLARARRALDYSGPLALALSDRVSVPTLIGWRRPLCVLPSAAGATTQTDLEWLLVHELAHVRRADIAWNWAQSFAEVALFFHPAARWLARQIRHERECCCDAAVARTPAALGPYVHALTRLVLAAHPAPKPALSATGGTLVSRIERLIDPGLPTRAPALTRCLALALGALTGIGVLVACETEEPADPPAPTPVTNDPPAPAAAPPTEAPPATNLPDEPATGEPTKVAREPEPGPWLDDPNAPNEDGC